MSFRVPTSHFWDPSPEFCILFDETAAISPRKTLNCSSRMKLSNPLNHWNELAYIIRTIRVCHRHLG